MAVLCMASNANKGIRQGRKARVAEPVPTAAAISGAVFSYRTLLEMRNRYNEAHRELNLAGRTDVQRELAIAIIRAFANAR
jgi:hypothetical protein